MDMKKEMKKDEEERRGKLWISSHLEIYAVSCNQEAKMRQECMV